MIKDILFFKNHGLHTNGRSVQYADTSNMHQQFIVLRPDDISEDVLLTDLDYGIHGRYTESEYCQYLESIQPFIEQYAATGSITEVDFKSWEDITCTNIKQRDFESLFKKTWLDLRSGDCIVAAPDVNGKYHTTNGGRHRMQIAKKYGYSIIAYAYVANKEAVD